MATMSDDRVLRALRKQAWQRAKGELQAVAETFFGADESARVGQFDEYIEVMDAFIERVESRGLAE